MKNWNNPFNGDCFVVAVPESDISLVFFFVGLTDGVVVFWSENLRLTDVAGGGVTGGEISLLSGSRWMLSKSESNGTEPDKHVDCGKGDSGV